MPERGTPDGDMADGEMFAEADRALAACGSILELNTVLTDLLRPFAITAYAVGYVPEAGSPAADPFLLLTWPRTWLELYAREGFAQEDAVIAAGTQATAPFTWRELQAAQPGASARVFAAAEATFGWVDGLLVPIRSEAAAGRLGVASLAATVPIGNDPGTRLYLAEVSRLAFERAIALASEAVALSQREREVLGLVAQGRNDREIAASLGLAVATARFHVEQAKRKLGARTRSQAVAQALSQGLVG